MIIVFELQHIFSDIDILPLFSIQHVENNYLNRCPKHNRLPYRPFFKLFPLFYTKFRDDGSSEHIRH